MVVTSFLLNFKIKHSKLIPLRRKDWINFRMQGQPERTIVLCCYGATATIEKEIFIVALRKALGEVFVITFEVFGE
ncbi:hypothetical protein ACB092_05G139300 [Castanea dentata]